MEPDKLKLNLSNNNFGYVWQETRESEEFGRWNWWGWEHPDGGNGRLYTSQVEAIEALKKHDEEPKINLEN